MNDYDKYLMAMGTDVEAYSDLMELALSFIVAQIALECRSMLGIAWNIEPGGSEEESHMHLYTLELDEAYLAGILFVLMKERNKWYAAHS